MKTDDVSSIDCSNSASNVEPPRNPETRGHCVDVGEDLGERNIPDDTIAPEGRDRHIDVGGDLAANGRLIKNRSGRLGLRFTTVDLTDSCLGSFTGGQTTIDLRIESPCGVLR